MTPEQVAERWQCSARHVRNLINERRLPAFRLGGKLWRIRGEDVREFEQCQSGGWEDTEDSGRRSADTDHTGPVVRLERIVERQNG